jgi:hypothetical protein
MNYSDALDEGLKRTTTLAEDGKVCDFRYKRVKDIKLDIIVASLVITIIVVLSITILLITRHIFLKRKSGKVLLRHP